MECVFRGYIISLKQAKDPLPPNNDLVEFDMRKNTKNLEKNLKLQGCPSGLQEKVKNLVTDDLYVFCEDEFCRPIRGSSFYIDTNNHPPIFCKPPRYFPHESEVMQNLVEPLEKNGVVGAENLHQENVPWHKYQWRLCVSYHKLNQVTLSFTLPIPRCDNEVQYIETEVSILL